MRTARPRGDVGLLIAALEPRQHLAQAIGADHHRHVLHTVGERAQAEGEALDAIGLVDADAGDEQADESAISALMQRAAAQRDHAGDAEDDQREVLGRGEPDRDAGERLGHRHHEEQRQEAAEQGGQQHQAQRSAARPAAGHGMAVPEQRDVERLARARGTGSR